MSDKPDQKGARQPDLDDSLTQSERFMKAARELETDDDPERFKERVRRVAGHTNTDDGKAKKN